MSAEIVEALFEIAHVIAEEKKLHKMVEILIKPCMSKAAGFVLGKIYSKTMAKISLSNSTSAIKTGPVQNPEVKIPNDIIPNVEIPKIKIPNVENPENQNTKVLMPKELYGALMYQCTKA